jgi:hypothetical protein
MARLAQATRREALGAVEWANGIRGVDVHVCVDRDPHRQSTVGIFAEAELDFSYGVRQPH